MCLTTREYSIIEVNINARQRILNPKACILVFTTFALQGEAESYCFIDLAF